jgi:DnaJ-class molecular chaperone
MPEAVQNVIDCETCQGSGEIDETLGGEYFSNQHAKCPDCDGTGEITLTSPPAVQTAVPSERGEK